MALLLRIFLALTIVFALASIYSGMQLKNKKTQLETELQSNKDNVAQLNTKLGAAQKEGQDTQEKLTSKSKELEAATAQIAQKSKEIASQTSKMKDVEAKLVSVSKEFSGTKAEIEKIKKSLPEGVTIDELQGKLQSYQEQLMNLTQERTVLNEQLTKLTEEKKKLDESAKMKREGKMPAGLTGHILAVNEDWNFVVLDIGTNQGVIENAEMVVYREGTLIGKVKITSAEPSIAIGDILKNWKKASIREGDAVGVL